MRARASIPSLALVATLMTALTTCAAADRYQPRNGDIIFHVSRSAQSEAIQRATGSRYSHMGIVFLRQDGPHVLEAIEPVSLTPLAVWIARGEGGHFVVKRLAGADTVLTEAALIRMLAVGRQFQGKHYDLWFGWSDDRVYCSELVWKIYRRALGIELGALQHFRDFDLSHPVVRDKLRQRFGDSLPEQEPVISPVAVFSASSLIVVHEE